MGEGFLLRIRINIEKHSQTTHLKQTDENLPSTLPKVPVGESQAWLRDMSSDILDQNTASKKSPQNKHADFIQRDFISIPQKKNKKPKKSSKSIGFLLKFSISHGGFLGGQIVAPSTIPSPSHSPAREGSVGRHHKHR